MEPLSLFFSAVDFSLEDGIFTAFLVFSLFVIIVFPITGRSLLA